MFSKYFIIASGELDIISLKYSMLGPEDIFWCCQGSALSMNERTILVLRTSYVCSWIDSSSLIVYLNVKSFLPGDKGNS